MKTLTTRCNTLSATILLSAWLNVLGQPKLATQPVDQSVSLGATVQFRVTATSTAPPIRYQWRFAAAYLEGQTNSVLNLTNIQVLNAGDYDAVLTDGSGSVTSRAAHLEVDPTFTKITTGDIVTDVASHLSSAWGDYDGDGDIDLAVTGTWIADSGAGSRIRLFRNDGFGHFTRILSTPISADAKDWRAGSWIDYDNDGWLDLITTHTRHHSFDGGIMFFRNEGQGSFRKLTSRDVGPILPGTPPNTEDNVQGAGWADYDRDGFLDVYVSLSGEGTDWLFRNLGDGTFAKMSNSQTGIAADRAYSYGITWGDFDGDGWPDLFVPV
ncbi:MAG: VCBS repeat-containing protein, partial [Verrucomicrobia bacterium]|nr:VCBS repeat-containing protein [Verrucomicrobiota bacterium]